MRSNLLFVILGVALASGCAINKNRTCQPMMSWASPASTCTVAVAPVVIAEPPPPKPEPRVKLTDKKIEIMETVQFETGKAVLLPKSEDLLMEIVGVMKEHPEIKQVQVEGHTDSEGGTKANMKLSDARAKAVRDFLVNKGIESKRLIPKGFGETVPEADNATEEGRFKNRRVEFKILKRD
jgi:outer membrane protein OmpA-like peptidoglycan-associated protein